MNLGLLRDFLAVAELGSFSRAADARAITQPAMSRHIKSLEDHLGLQLIDRSIFPASLTPAGQRFYALAQKTLDSFERGVTEIQQQDESAAGEIRFAMQHVLASEFFTMWWQQQPQHRKPGRVAVQAINLHDCVQKLENGHIDLMLCYQPRGEQLSLDRAIYGIKKVGDDSLVPVAAVSAQGMPSFTLSQQQKLPLASSGHSDFMGKIVDTLIAKNQATNRFERIYEDSFSEGVRSQVVAGTAVGWLPLMLVQRDIDAGNLAVIGEQSWQQPLDIYLSVRLDRLSGSISTVWDAL